MQNAEILTNIELIENMSELFKTFGDPTRIKILINLIDNELCVQDICNNLNMNQSAISHQLKTLKNIKLIKSRRDGKQIYYSLSDEHVKDIINIGCEHLME